MEWIADEWIRYTSKFLGAKKAAEQWKGSHSLENIQREL
jgi:hypothetical protein